MRQAGPSLFRVLTVLRFCSGRSRAATGLFYVVLFSFVLIRRVTCSHLSAVRPPWPRLAPWTEGGRNEGEEVEKIVALTGVGGNQGAENRSPPRGLGDVSMHLTNLSKAPALCQTPGRAPGRRESCPHVADCPGHVPITLCAQVCECHMHVCAHPHTHTGPLFPSPEHTRTCTVCVSRHPQVHLWPQSPPHTHAHRLRL